MAQIEALGCIAAMPIGYHPVGPRRYRGQGGLAPVTVSGLRRTVGFALDDAAGVLEPAGAAIEGTVEDAELALAAVAAGSSGVAAGVGEPCGSVGRQALVP
jgi:hypothetical protein